MHHLPSLGLNVLTSKLYRQRTLLSNSVSLEFSLPHLGYTFQMPLHLSVLQFPGGTHTQSLGAGCPLSQDAARRPASVLTNLLLTPEKMTPFPPQA